MNKKNKRGCQQHPFFYFRHTEALAEVSPIEYMSLITYLIHVLGILRSAQDDVLPLRLCCLTGKNPAKEPLLKLPEEFELAENKSVGQQKNIVDREN